MPTKAQDDDLKMNLVELALARPADEREAYIRTACAGDSELFDQAWNYVQWDQRMNGFLLDPARSSVSRRLVERIRVEALCAARDGRILTF